MGRGISVCQITIDSDRPKIRIEGDYVRLFYEQIKDLIPPWRRAYISSGRYWIVDKEYFCRVFELAYEHFSKIHLIENGRAEEYIPQK